MTHQRNIFGRLREVCDTCNHPEDSHDNYSTTGQGKLRDYCRWHVKGMHCGCSQFK